MVTFVREQFAGTGREYNLNYICECDSDKRSRGIECFCDLNQILTGMLINTKENETMSKVTIHVNQILEDRQGNIVFYDSKNGHSIIIDNSLLEGSSGDLLRSKLTKKDG